MIVIPDREHALRQSCSTIWSAMQPRRGRRYDVQSQGAAGPWHRRETRRTWRADRRRCAERQVDRRGSGKIAALPDLRAVKLSKQPITDAGLQKLLMLKKLKSLGLDETEVTDAGLAALEKLPALEELLLANTQIGDAGIEHLLRLPKLKRLRLSGTKVTDAGAARLATLKTLEDLDLSKTAIGNEGLAALGQLPKLVKLNLWTTRVTDARPGVARIAPRPEVAQSRQHGRLGRAACRSSTCWSTSSFCTSAARKSAMPACRT